MLSTRLACSVAAFVCLTAATASAQPSDKRTLFTFSAPVALPGVTLAPGQYVFRLADPYRNSDVVQVLNADGTKPYGLFLTLPADRGEPASGPEIRFRETPAGRAPAIEAWWYPGERRGYAFFGPKQPRNASAANATPAVNAQSVPDESATGSLPWSVAASRIPVVGSGAAPLFAGAGASPDPKNVVMAPSADGADAQRRSGS